MTIKEFFSNLTDFSKYTPRILFALTLLCGFFLFVNNTFTREIGLETIQSEYRPYFGFGFLLFGSLLLSYPLVEGTKWIFKLIKEKAQYYRRVKNYEEFITMLTSNQKSILKSFLENNTRTVQLNYEDGDVRELVNAQILYLPGNLTFFDRYKLDGMYTDFNLYPVVYKLIKKYPEKLD